MEYVTLEIRLLIRHDSKSRNHETVAPLVINQAQLDWPRREGFSCKRIEEHKQERVNTQSENCRCVWSENQDGVQALITKVLITTVVKKKNSGPEFTAKGLDITVTMNVFVSQGKTSTKQNSNLNVALATKYMLPRVDLDHLDTPLLSSNRIHRPTTQKTVVQHPDRF